MSENSGINYPGIISGFLTFSIFLCASKRNNAFFRANGFGRSVQTRGLHNDVCLMSISHKQWIALLRRGHFSALVVQKLTGALSNRWRYPNAVFSRWHFVGLKIKTSPQCSLTLKHSSWVLSVAIDPTGQFLASTCFFQNYVTLSQLNSDCSDAKYVSKLEGHSEPVSFVQFHPSKKNILATCSDDRTAKLWWLGEDGNAICVFTLKGHYDSVTSIAFCPSAPYLVTGSRDKTAKLWLLNADCSNATCVATLQGHSDCIKTVAFHPSAPYLATGSDDYTVKVWLLNADCSAATCVSTLKGHRDLINSIAFNNFGDYIVTASRDETIMIWQLNLDRSDVVCVCTLKHEGSVRSVAFHGSSAHCLVSCSNDRTAKVWLLNSDCSSVTQDCILRHTRGVTSVAFHPSKPYIVTGSEDNTANLWR